MHVYTFNKAIDPILAAPEICEEISEYLGHTITVGSVIVSKDNYSKKEEDEGESEPLEEGKAKIFFVRKVAPKKSFYCATFRIPRDVAFGEVKVLDGKTEDDGLYDQKHMS